RGHRRPVGGARPGGVAVSDRPGFRRLPGGSEALPPDLGSAVRPPAAAARGGRPRPALPDGPGALRAAARRPAGPPLPPLPPRPRAGPPAPPPPQWAQDLVAEVCASGCIAFADGGQPGTYGYCVGGRAGSPEIRFNLTPAEYVGGPHDGEVGLREFAVDV